MVIVGIGRSFDMIVAITSFSCKRVLPEDILGIASLGVGLAVREAKEMV